MSGLLYISWWAGPRIFGLLKRGDFKIDLGSPTNFHFNNNSVMLVPLRNGIYLSARVFVRQC
jgi:hypothetical protein